MNDDWMDAYGYAQMAISNDVAKQRLYDEAMRRKSREFEDALTDAMINGTGAVRQSAPQYSMAEIVLNDGSTQTFMLKASTSIVQHLVKGMRETGYLTMWNDTDVLCIRASEVKQFALRAFTKE